MRGYNKVCENMGVAADNFGWIMQFGLSVIMSNIDEYVISDC